MAWKKKANRKFRHEMDTNVFKIAFSTLKDKSELATGDPIFCEQCNAVFNINSKIDVVIDEKEESKVQKWTCEFCGQCNTIDIEDEEKPKSDQTNYVVEAAA